MNPRKVFIKTYGCQANINDSEILAGKLINVGNILVDNESEADKIIVNTCSVKNKTQSKILNYLKKNESLEIEVGGCLTKTLDLKKQFPKIKIIDTINANKLDTPILRFNNDIAIIQICQGCLNYCTFCSTKIARGNLKSYRIGDIKREFEKAIKLGARKVHLTSQDNGAYGKDMGTNLAELLKELTTIPGNYKVRVGMMNPWHLRGIKNELMEAFKSPKIQKFLHIPVQSGSERVLKDMKRIHSAKEFISIVREFREKFPREIFPDSTIATDIIVGYPTETDEDFIDTLNLIEKTKPEVLNISAFSSRNGTKASELKQLSSEIIKERTRKLNELYLSYRKNLVLPILTY